MILDSNIIIYSIEPQNQGLRDFLIANAPVAASAISLVEVLGFHRLRSDHKVQLEALFDSTIIYDVDKPVLDGAVMLRQQRKMSLGDAIIAATALVHDETLVTRNTADFAWIPNLKLLDPLAAAP